MKVLFIEAEECFYMDTRTKMLKRWVYLGEVATYIKKKVDYIKVMDCIESNISHCEILKEIEKNNYDLICCLTRIETLNSLIKLIPIIKEISPISKILLYGDIPCMYENFIKDNIIGVDCIVKSGDWDLIISNYIDYIEGKNNNLFGIIVNENKIWKDYSKNKCNEEFVSWEFTNPQDNLINTKLYKKLRNNQIVISISRGCPYNCKFCSAVATFRIKERRKKPIEIVEYMKKNKKNASLFKLFSPTFTYDEKWVFEFCELLIESELNVKWEVSSRPDCLQNEKLLEMMSKAGCSQISVGIETIDEISFEKLGKFNKKENYVDNLKTMFKLARKYNIKIYALLMLGIEGQTKENIGKTIKFLRENKCYRAKFSAYSPRQCLFEKDCLHKLSLQEINAMDKRTYINYLPDGMSKKEFYDLIYNFEI